MTLIINNAEVQSILAIDDFMRLMEEAALEHAAGDSPVVPRIDALVSRGRSDSVYIYGSMQAGSARQKAYAVRIKSDVVYWEHAGDVVTEEKYAGRPGLYCGLVFLFSTETGEPLAIIHDGYLQHMRVGARVGLSAKHLAREDSRVIGVIGSGGMARSNVLAISKVRPIERVQVYSPTPENLARYVDEMSEALGGIDVVPVRSGREAVAGADVVCLCTDSIKPVIEPGWIMPGVHLTQMQLAEIDFDPMAMFDVVFALAPTPVPLGRDAPLAKGNLEFAGSPEAVEAYPKSRRNWERVQPIASTAENAARVVFLADLALGKVPGRSSATDRTYHGTNSIGGGSQGLEFISVAPTIFEEARKRGLGHEIPTEWLLQDIRD